MTAEPAPVVGGRRGCVAPDDDTRPHEALGADEVDAESGQFGGCLLEELLGVIDGQLDRGRLVRGRQFGGDVDTTGQRVGEAW